MSEQDEQENIKAEESTGSEPLEGSGTGPRDKDETVSAEDLITLHDEPTPMEPSG